MSRVDLHTHSYFSDGALSPTALVHAAKSAGVTMLALTDHDTISGIAEAAAAAAACDIEFINGIELSTQWQKPITTSKKTTQNPIAIHVVGLGMTHLAPLETAIATQQAARLVRAKTICDLLLNITKVDIWQHLSHSLHNNSEQITRAHIAQAMVETGIVQKHQQAFDKYLTLGKRAYVPLTAMTIAEAIDIIHRSGGSAVLAHPTRYPISSTQLRALIAQFADLGGDALELPRLSEPSGTKDLINRLIQAHGFAVSTASDFHGPHMPWHKLGVVPPVSAAQQPIWLRGWQHISPANSVLE